MQSPLLCVTQIAGTNSFLSDWSFCYCCFLTEVSPRGNFPMHSDIIEQYIVQHKVDKSEFLFLIPLVFHNFMLFHNLHK